MSDRSTTSSATSVIVRCAACEVLNRVPQQKLKDRPVCGKCRAALEIPTEPVFVRADSFGAAIANWPEMLLVVFTAPMCVRCKIVEPVLIDLARDRAGKLKILTVDTEMEPALTRRFKVEQTPTFVMYKNGSEILRFDGPPRERSDVVKWIDSLAGHESD